MPPLRDSIWARSRLLKTFESCWSLGSLYWLFSCSTAALRFPSLPFFFLLFFFKSSISDLEAIRGSKFFFLPNPEETPVAITALPHGHENIPKIKIRERGLLRQERRFCSTSCLRLSQSHVSLSVNRRSAEEAYYVWSPSQLPSYFFLFIGSCPHSFSVFRFLPSSPALLPRTSTKQNKTRRNVKWTRSCFKDMFESSRQLSISL